MNNKIVIALDCMGGDNAPGCVIEGVNVLDKSLKEELFFLLYGDENKINRYLNKYPDVKKILLKNEWVVIMEENPQAQNDIIRDYKAIIRHMDGPIPFDELL